MGTEQSAGRHIRQCTTYKCVHAGLFVMLSLADNWKYLGARSQARSSLLVSSDCTLPRLLAEPVRRCRLRHGCQTHTLGWSHARWSRSHIESLRYRGVVCLRACRVSARMQAARTNMWTGARLRNAERRTRVRLMRRETPTTRCSGGSALGGEPAWSHDLDAIHCWTLSPVVQGPDMCMLARS